MSKILKVPNSSSRPPYKLAKAYSGSNEWFVAYSFWSLRQQKYIRDKVRVGVRGMTEVQRISLLNEVAAALNKELKKLNKEGIYRDENELPDSEKKLLTLLEWVDYAQLEKKNSLELNKTYSKISHNLKNFFVARPLYKLIEPWNWSTEIMEEFVDHMKSKGLAGKTINDQIYGFDKLMEYLVKKKILNDSKSYADLRVKHAKNETGKYIPLIHEEKEAVFKYYRENYPEYYLYLLGIYYTCIRPGEQHRLKVSNYNLNARSIYVPWFSAKNKGLSAHVQILEPYHNELLSFKVDQLPKNWFLFGERCLPSADQFLKEDYSTKHWFRHAHKIGLDKGKTAYGLKHSFNIDYVENNKYNLDWEWLRRHNRHATIQQTQDYISELTAFFLDEAKSIILDYTKK